MALETRTVSVDDETVSAVFNAIRAEAWIRVLIPAEGDYTAEWRDMNRAGIHEEQLVARQEGETCVVFSRDDGPLNLEQAHMSLHDANNRHTLVLSAYRSGETWQGMHLGVLALGASETEPLLDLPTACSSDLATKHALLHLVSLALQAPDGKAPASE